MTDLYYEKYIKYKLKYDLLKKQIAGASQGVVIQTPIIIRLDDNNKFNTYKEYFKDLIIQQDIKNKINNAKKNDIIQITDKIGTPGILYELLYDGHLMKKHGTDDIFKAKNMEMNPIITKK